MRLARVRRENGAVVVMRGSEDAVATVAGQTFADLPELLAAAGGDPARIERGDRIAVQDRDLLCIVERPRKIVCIGLNYRLHAEESGAEIPKYPVLFPKWDNALTGPFDDIPLPSASHRVDWESELAFVFGRRCRNVPAAEAGSVVFGFTAANDVSMRDFQFHSSQWAPGKCWDRSTPAGPDLATCDEVGGVEPNLAIRGRLNGEVVQDSRTNDLIFGVPALVEYITRIMTMEPGDLVLTGTPSGVGQSRKPPRFLSSGDVYEVEIESLRGPRNRFVAG